MKVRLAVAAVLAAALLLFALFTLFVDVPSPTAELRLVAIPPSTESGLRTPPAPGDEPVESAATVSAPPSQIVQPASENTPATTLQPREPQPGLVKASEPAPGSGQPTALQPLGAAPRKTTSDVGKVIEVEGPVGSVIVVRGAQSYAVQADDLLFEGDRIVTRTNGRARLQVRDCERWLEPTSSIVIGADFCEIAPVALAGIAQGVAVAAAPAGAADVGATPGVLGLLATTGAAASMLPDTKDTVF